MKKYVKDNAYKLDLPYTQDRTTELCTWFLKLRADVDNLQKGGAVQLCQATCPNNRWIYDAAECSCLCDTSCLNPGEEKDYYNCNCVPTNGCALTNEICDNSFNMLLDYANCKCKSKP